MTIELANRRSGRRARSSPSFLHSVLHCSDDDYLTDCMRCPLTEQTKFGNLLGKIFVYARAENPLKISKKNLRWISHRSKFSYMYVCKKSSKLVIKSSLNFSHAKILVYVRAEKILKISKKNLRWISHWLKFSYMYVCKKSSKLVIKSPLNFSQVKILAYARV